MSIKVDWSGLYQAVKQMGAPLKDFKIHIEQQALNIEAKPIDLELKFLDEVIEYQGVLTYHGQQIVLYIPEPGKRFHITECKTIQEMKQAHRFGRYVISNDLSGEFKVYCQDAHGLDWHEKKERLMVCRNCLWKLNYQNYQYKRADRTNIWHRFDLKAFFESYQVYFQDLPEADLNHQPGYVEDWSTISKNYRRQHHYICEQCGVDLSQHKYLLHVHHRDGVKRNNQPNNLKALCADCHSHQPMHQHMQVSAQDLEQITKLRKQQGLL